MKTWAEQEAEMRARARSAQEHAAYDADRARWFASLGDELTALAYQDSAARASAFARGFADAYQDFVTPPAWARVAA